MKTIIILSVVYVLCVVAFFGTIGYVAMHFISKFW